MAKSTNFHQEPIRKSKVENKSKRLRPKSNPKAYETDRKLALVDCSMDHLTIFYCLNNLLRFEEIAFLAQLQFTGLYFSD